MEIESSTQDVTSLSSKGLLINVELAGIILMLLLETVTLPPSLSDRLPSCFKAINDLAQVYAGDCDLVFSLLTDEY
jgi:hypothetical protein